MQSFLKVIAALIGFYKECKSQLAGNLDLPPRASEKTKALQLPSQPTLDYYSAETCQAWSPYSFLHFSIAIGLPASLFELTRIKPAREN